MMMKSLTTIVILLALVGTASANELSPEAQSKIDALNKVNSAQRISTRAAKAAVKAVLQPLKNERVTGRSCDLSDEDDDNPSCYMEDGTEISVEAVPVKLTQAEAETKCAASFFYKDDENKPGEIIITMQQVSKVEFRPARGSFKLLLCTYAADDSSKEAAQRRINPRLSLGVSNMEVYMHEVVPAIALASVCKLKISAAGLAEHDKIMAASKTDEKVARRVRLLHTTWQEMYIEARNKGQKDQFCKDFISNHDYVSFK